MKQAVAVLAILAASSCSDETVARLRVRFPDCSIDSTLVGTLVFVLEPADGSELVGLVPGSEQIDGVEVSGDDVDADGMLEWVLRVRRAEHRIQGGFDVRVVAREKDPREIVVTLVAGDDENRQIGRLAGEPPTFRFQEGEEQTIDLPIICMCNGMEGCGGTCEGPDEGPDCRPEGDHESYCHDGLANDADELTDCADPECYRRGPCEACDVEVCDNGADDDCDGDIDCGDDLCVSRLLCQGGRPEDCDNGGDDDRDHLRDCLDPDCADDASCTGACTPVQEVCDNRRDDDCDHRVDCVDDECARPAAETACEDGFDDDCDDRVDCDDPDCYETCGCEADAEEERDEQPDGCHDGLDNDCDGDFDCEDPDCVDAKAEVCDDTIDNDCDGANNCADDDCPLGAATEICDDLFDNDCDSLFDCEDPRCRRDRPPERACGDFLDNDCDDKFDCEDGDCNGNPACPTTSN